MVWTKRVWQGIFLTGTLSLSLSLTAGCGGAAHVSGVGIEPRSVTLSPGQTQVFTAGSLDIVYSGIVWRIVEGERGGSFVDVVNPQRPLAQPNAVTYTAPAAKGTYHLRASLVSNASGDNSAEATIQVR